MINKLLLSLYMTMPVALINVDLWLSINPHTWPNLTWIYSFLLPLYMAIPVAQIWLHVAPRNGHDSGPN